MADNSVDFTSVLARAIRLQKTVNAETAVSILAQDVSSEYNIPENLAKIVAQAAVAGDFSLIKVFSDKKFTVDMSQRVGFGGSDTTPQWMVSAQKKHDGMESASQEIPSREGFKSAEQSKGAPFHSTVGVTKTESKETQEKEESLLESAKSKVSEMLEHEKKEHKEMEKGCDECFEKAMSELAKSLPANCGHCDNGCTCGRGPLSAMYKNWTTLAKADPPGADAKDRSKDKKDTTSDKKEVDAKKPMDKPDTEAPAAPKDAPLPATGGIAGMDVGAAGAAPPGGMAPPMAPPSPNPMASPTAALEFASLIAEAIENIQALVGEAAAAAAPPAPPMPAAPPMGPEAAMDPMSMVPGGPSFDDVPAGGTKGLYLDEEGGAEEPPRYGLAASAQNIRKALFKNEGVGSMVTATPGAYNAIVGTDGKKTTKIAKAILAAADAKEGVSKKEEGLAYDGVDQAKKGKKTMNKKEEGLAYDGVDQAKKSKSKEAVDASTSDVQRPQGM